MWKLVIEDDEGKRTVVPLTRDHYSMGRREGNTIRLTERNVSRDHARLYKRNGAADSGKTRSGGTRPAEGAIAPEGETPSLGSAPAFVLEDLTSYNGVFVNGLRVAHAQDLAHGDLVQIGDYRIVLQDEALAEIQPVGGVGDAQPTIPMAPTARAAALLDRPNRLVMLAGPTPGSEFPLDRERLTIGRAEDASISVNHNSVSRLHCEVHALGDARFEIVDKGSSNGVRVNGAELRRGIVEPGDVIELGDVRFKFIGAGQIFRPTESQQLAAIGDRVATDSARRDRGNLLPIAAFVAVVVAGAFGAWSYTRPQVDRLSLARAAAPSPERALVDQARRLCASGACEAAHEKVGTLPDGSPLRVSSDFKEVENKWADELLARADAEGDGGDAAARRASYQRVAQTVTVDVARRKLAADKLQALESSSPAAATNAAELPVAAASAAADAGAPPPTPPRPDAGRRVSIASAAESQQPLAPLSATPPPPSLAPSPKLPTATVDDRERQLALQGTQDSKMLLKQQLEQRVYSGKASDTEIRLLISTCKDLGDKPCVQLVRSIQAQRP